MTEHAETVCLLPVSPARRCPRLLNNQRDPQLDDTRTVRLELDDAV